MELALVKEPEMNQANEAEELVLLLRREIEMLKNVISTWVSRQNLPPYSPLPASCNWTSDIGPEYFGPPIPDKVFDEFNKRGAG